MSDYPHLQYSKRTVERAGKVIASNLPWNDETEPKIREAFTIANNWRDSHAYPMRSIRHSVIYYMGDIGVKGITAARLKRMQAIRRKLRRFKYSLQQLQDLGGCRVILPTISDVERLVRTVKERIRQEIKTEDNYVLEPKVDGYRSHHLIFSFSPRDPGKAAYKGRRIELQVRTQLQHSWATAIEAVGLFRCEELKSNQGNREWLRLFTLMSAEFAEAEHCSLPPDTPSTTERREEIQHLAQRLDGEEVLDRIIYGVRGTDFPTVGYKPHYYLIRYDHLTKTVSVRGVSKGAGAKFYDKAEELGNTTGNETEDVVLVEVDKIENLKKAYPNYFGDVEVFRNQLRLITRGQSAVEYTTLPKQKLPPRPTNERVYNPFGAGHLPKPSLPKKRKRADRAGR
jgi:hypothetical protein